MQSGKPLTSMVYDAVYGGIINGTITNNDILTENSLVEQLGVSKSPVRGALLLLCEEHVLQAIPRLGYQVLQITPDQMTKLCEARMALEPFLLQKGWASFDGDPIRRLQAQVRDIKRDELTNESIQANWQRNMDFHMLLGSFGGNEYLLGSLDKVLRDCARAAAQYYFHTRGIPRGEDDYHDEILTAITNHDFTAAQEALQKDIREMIP